MSKGFQDSEIDFIDMTASEKLFSTPTDGASWNMFGIEDAISIFVAEEQLEVLCEEELDAAIEEMGRDW